MTINLKLKRAKSRIVIWPGSRPARVLKYLQEKSDAGAPWASNPELQELLGLTQTCQVGRVLRIALREGLVKQNRVPSGSRGGPARVWWRITKDGK